MRPLYAASIGLLIFIGGFLVAAFELYTLTRYGAPNPALGTNLLVQRDFWIFLFGVALFLGGGFCYFWNMAPSSPFKELIRNASPKAAISIVLSCVSLIGIPVSRFVGPWDIVQGLVVLVSVGLILLIALLFSILSLTDRRRSILPAVAILWWVAAAAIMYAKLMALGK